MTAEIVIRGGKIVDGSGNPWFKADVGIKDGEIAKVSRVPLKEGERIIDAKGLVVAPGFIDMHTHSDSNILFHPKCENFVRQGVTTAVMGSCGSSIAPITESYKEVVRRRLQLQTQEPELFLQVF